MLDFDLVPPQSFTEQVGDEAQEDHDGIIHLDVPMLVEINNDVQHDLKVLPPIVLKRFNIDRQLSTR